jgi:hypothetical protein
VVRCGQSARRAQRAATLAWTGPCGCSLRGRQAVAERLARWRAKRTQGSSAGVSSRCLSTARGAELQRDVGAMWCDGALGGQAGRKAAASDQLIPRLLAQLAAQPAQAGLQAVAAPAAPALRSAQVSRGCCRPPAPAWRLSASRRSARCAARCAADWLRSQSFGSSSERRHIVSGMRRADRDRRVATGWTTRSWPTLVSRCRRPWRALAAHRLGRRGSLCDGVAGLRPAQNLGRWPAEATRCAFPARSLGQRARMAFGSAHVLRPRNRTSRCERRPRYRAARVEPATTVEGRPGQGPCKR